MNLTKKFKLSWVLPMHDQEGLTKMFAHMLQRIVYEHRVFQPKTTLQSGNFDLKNMVESHRQGQKNFCTNFEPYDFVICTMGVYKSLCTPSYTNYKQDPVVTSTIKCYILQILGLFSLRYF